MLHWAAENPHAALATMAGVVAAIYGFIKFLLARHAEFVTFSEHMDREETEVWPAVQKQQQEMRDQMASNHLEGMTMLRDHGARITALEERMPDGQLRRIEEMLIQILGKKQ